MVVPDEYGSITEAINNATDGQTVYVKSGVYNEYITINKALQIIGENKANTIIRGNGTGILFKIVSDNVSISGFWMQNAETAIHLKKVKNCRILGNKFTNFSTYSTLTGGIAIYADSCNNLTIKENFATDADYFLLCLLSSNNCKISYNTFISDRRMCQAIKLENSHNNIIEWNKIYGKPELVTEGGIGLSHSNGNLIRFNDIKENDWCGISLYISDKTVIMGNNITFQRIQTGLYMYNSIDTLIYCNNFIANLKDVIMEGGVKNTCWHHLGLGNYWDKYEGEDNNYDGIGDTPYIAEGQNDTCPLMGQYYPFRLFVEGKKEIIDVVSNSTIIKFNSANQENISLKVAGELGHHGFSLIKIPKSLIRNPNATVNGKIPLKVNIKENEDFALLYMLYTYEQEENEINVIPEFSLWPLLLLLACLTLLFLTKKESGKYNSFTRQTNLIKSLF
ncbi:MAG: right-handed parallel beta-helix repeat-containing protein [Candidatus Odinarchaeia archaeon]